MNEVLWSMRAKVNYAAMPGYNPLVSIVIFREFNFLGHFSSIWCVEVAVVTLNSNCILNYFPHALAENEEREREGSLFKVLQHHPESRYFACHGPPLFYSSSPYPQRARHSAADSASDTAAFSPPDSPLF